MINLVLKSIVKISFNTETHVVAYFETVMRKKFLLSHYHFTVFGSSGPHNNIQNTYEIELLKRRKFS